jgi:small subunit ribosomal protein S11
MARNWVRLFSSSESHHTMASSLASTSRTLWRTAAAHSPAVRSLATVPTPSPAATITPTPDPSSASPLPEAYRAPANTTPSSIFPSASQVPVEVRTRGAFSSNKQTHPYKLSVFTSRNNTILTLSTAPRAPDAITSSTVNIATVKLPLQVPVSWVSAGSAGYKGAARGTYDAGVEVSIRMFKKIQEMINPPVGVGGQRRKTGLPAPTELEVVWKGFGQGRDAVFRTLMGGEGDAVRHLVKRVTDAVSPGG